MKEYVCTICGYIHKGELPSEFRCPVCGAGRDAFTEIKPKEQSESTDIARPDIRGELSAMEISVICSNLARGCEKQYKPEEMTHFEAFRIFQGGSGEGSRGHKRTERAVGKGPEREFSLCKESRRTCGRQRRHEESGVE